MTTPASARRLRRLLETRWPLACPAVPVPQTILRSGVETFDALFAAGGLPAGQLIEITGARGAGKTRLALWLVRALTRYGRVVYCDFPRSFFPPGAAAAGVALEALRIVRPRSVGAGLRAVERLFDRRAACAALLDLVGMPTSLPGILVHRLRQKTVRSGAVVIFLTEAPAQPIGGSLVALRLEVARRAAQELEVMVTRSRIAREGARVRIPFGA